MRTTAARPHIVCWLRLGFGREHTVAALRKLEEIELTVVESLEELLPSLASADALVLHSAPVELARSVVSAIRSAGGRLRWMHFLTAGRDGFEAAGLPRSMLVTHVTGASAPAVAEHALALLLALGRQVPSSLELARAKRWDRFAVGRFVSLEGSQVAVLGAGAIGKEIARRLRAFGARPIGLSRTGTAQPEFAEMQPIARLHEVLARCAAALVAVPLNESTRHLLDAPAFAAMPPGALLVNIARGAVLDQGALCDALERGHLGGAALDVTDPEPPTDNDPIWRCPNLLLTPHVAVEGSEATLQRLASGTAENVRRFACGEPLLDAAAR